MDDRSKRYQAAKETYLERQELLEKLMEEHEAVLEEREAKVAAFAEPHKERIDQAIVPVETAYRTHVEKTQALERAIDLVQAKYPIPSGVGGSDGQRKAAIRTQLLHVAEVELEHAPEIAAAQKILDRAKAAYAAVVDETKREVQAVRDEYTSKIEDAKDLIQKAAARAAQTKVAMRSILDEGAEESQQ